MKRLFALFCGMIGFLALPGSASATPVTWNVQGHLTYVEGAPPDFVSGAAFSILVHFDSAAALLGSFNGSTGTRYSYDASALSFDFFIGTFCNPCHIGASEPGNTGLIYLRDNFSAPPGFPEPIDGYTFNIKSNDGQSISIIMRGPLLDLVDGPGLQENPDPRLASFELPNFNSSFQVCRPSPNCTSSAIGGDIESVNRLPEPSALALLAAGLAGLARTGRRRQHPG